ncbi:FHA domain protein (macronuclear) [Tetrahymena thermophila SB210]|uniref:FHA domain protein n=1 Tax=Tetrahymena thermophila (strain SB210) TaxID=312017 RepID=Q22ZA5_TETTS|nr:FHA domain protein [Tetrahymena thermophila SB210]EAR90416.2 FHA domain protein [Tetrahymena thermophila SB210]|eukprot:XP_001010661.2 FHA domain protein [Tetrahymena thermophila SB210]
MDIREKFKMAIKTCKSYQFKRYFIQMIYQRLWVLESEYHCSYEENKNKDYSEVIGSLQKMINALQVLRNHPKFDQFGKNGQFWDSYRVISELFNEFVLRLKQCRFVYTCGVDNGILDLLMVPDTGFYKQIFQKIDAMHDYLKESAKKWGVIKELESELSLLFWYTEIQNQNQTQKIETITYSQLQNCLDQFSLKFENLRFDQNSLVKLQQEKSVLNAAQNILSKYKPGLVGPDYVETVMNIVYANPSLKYTIFCKEKNENMQQSLFGQESLAIGYAEPLYLQVVECLMDLSNVKHNEIIKITPKTITLGEGKEQPLNQPGVVYFGRQTNKNQPIQNDVSFPSQVTRVSRQQFQIVCESMNYYSIICTSPSNPTYLKVEDMPYELQKNMIFKIGEFKFLITDVKNEESVYGQPLDLSTTQSLKKLTRLNVNMDNEPPILEQYKTTLNEIDLLDKSQNQSQNIPYALGLSQVPELYSGENTIKTKEQDLKSSNQSKPFIEFKCIVGEYNQKQGEEPKLFREEVVQDNQVVVVTFGRDQRNKYPFTDKEISRFHCQIVYDSQKRWKICEKYIPDQKNFSSGGTFIQLQNYEQNRNESYSNPCPLSKGMLIHSEGTTFKVI